MEVQRLPRPALGIPKTLRIVYEDGNQLKVPYFDLLSTMAFLEGEENVSYFVFEEYQGE